MGRAKSSFSLFGGLFGSKKRTRSVKPTRKIWRYVWLFFLVVTGSGGLAGASEYDALRALWNILRARAQHSPTASTSPNQDGSPQTGDASNSPIRVYFTTPAAETPGDIAHSVVKYIDATRKTLDVAAFELDNRIITDALVRAVKRGIQVRLVTETDYVNEIGVKALRAVGVQVVDNQRSGLMHNKFMVFDRWAVWTGSMNFTENCAYKNNNNGVFIVDAKLAENYAVKFSWMFEKRKFGGLPSKTDRIPNPMITLSDNTQIENYFSTHDRPANHVVETLKLAKKFIHFMAFSFTHDGIGREMMARAANGVDVQGVFEKTQTAGEHSEYFKMRDAGLHVYLDGNSRNMHHKVIIIDGEIVIFGSFNFSESADKSNDENLLIVYNRNVAARFEEEYQRVLQTARNAQLK